MRSIIGLLASITMAFSFGGNFFTLSYTALNGSTVNPSAYTGKKVIVFAFNGSHPDIAMLHILDSLQRAKGDSIQVLGFPALEWDSAVTVQKLTHLRDSMGLTIALAQPARVQK